MVVDTLENAHIYYPIGKNFEAAFEYLKKNDIRKMEPGRYDIDGDDIFILVQDYTSKTIDNCGLESHDKYADVHFVAEGFEYLGYVARSRAGEPVTEYDPKADARFYEKECQYVLLQEGDIAIVLPGDVHMPQKRAMVPSHDRKACNKLRVD